MEKETKPTYLELISKDEKEVKRENLKIKAQEAALAVARETLTLNTEISVKKGLLERAQRAIPYNVKAEYVIAKELEQLEEALAFVQAVKAERFTDAVL